MQKVTSAPQTHSTTPKVSIATCTFDRPDFLREAVESLRAQTDPDWEHLIFDNGSTDPRVPKVLAWAREDPRVRVFRGRENQDRPARFWNYLLDRARGRYLGTLDDDNTKLPDFVRAMSGELDRDPALGLVTCGFVVRARGQRDWEHHHNMDTSPETTAERSTCEGGATLYRREAFERVGYFSEAIRTNEDWDWVRRAVRVLKYRNLPACLTTYRQHDANRQLRAEALGHAADVEVLRRREFRATLGARLVRPPSERLTRSQVDVVESVERALRAIPWVEPGEDVAILIAPFQMTDAEAREAVRGARRVLLLHMEDPYALAANLDRARALRSACGEVWVATNDLATMTHYRDVVGDRVVAWPSLGADDQIGLSPARKRDIDVLLCGYAYPSRRRLADALLPRLSARVVTLCGDGWGDRPVTPSLVWTFPTQPLPETYALHARARAVVCAHRVRGDCADGPVEPQTVNRGFMEGFSGARVFMDGSRPAHPFQDGDVVRYDGPEDLAEKINRYLDGGEPDPRATRFRETCRLLYTYRARVARILNCVRAPRFMAEIP